MNKKTLTWLVATPVVLAGAAYGLAFASGDSQPVSKPAANPSSFSQKADGQPTKGLDTDKETMDDGTGSVKTLETDKETKDDGKDAAEGPDSK